MKSSLGEKLSGFLKKNIWAIVGIVVLTGLFFVSFKKVTPLDTEHFYGHHSWLSGSTIRYVNNWLKEGAANLNFTNYNFPASVEYNTLEDRSAYLSYPTGEVFFVYSFAKVLGYQQIDISFLRKFQTVWFWFEAVLIFVFVWLFLKRTIKSKHSIENAAIALCSSVLWFLMPTCSYYLANVYFADQCVILWAIAYILASYIRWTSKEKKLPKIICILLLFSGILIDYYFWILVFCVFVYDFVVAIKTSKAKKLNVALKTIAFHGIPSILALIVFYIQLTRTNNWLSVMMAKFMQRTSSTGIGEKSSISMIFDNIANSFAANPEVIAFLILLVVFAVLLFVKLALKKNKKASMVENPGIAIFVVYFIATVIQLLALKNHSGIHEFSVIKVAWIVAMLPLFVATAIYYLAEQKTTEKNIKLTKRIKISGFGACFCVYAVMVIFATGIPFSTRSFYSSRWRIDQIDYSIAEVLAQETNYYDVVFSYTYEIPEIPPQTLSVSNKVVYKISDLSNISELFPNLSSEAKILLLVEKDDDSLEEGLELSQKQSIACIEKKGEKRYENEEFVLYEIQSESSCFKD